MKRLLNIFAITIFFSLIFHSCEHEDFFELRNPPEFPWLNITEFERAAVSPYNISFMSDWGGHFAIADRVIFDSKTDIIYHIPESSANYPVLEQYNRQTFVSTGRTQTAFAAGYRSIGLINAALDFYYDNDEDPYPNASLADKEHNLKRIAGELHFMRAFAYFHHTLRHCPSPGDPLFTTQEYIPIRRAFTDADAAMNAEFVTTDVIYDFIIEDLERAIELLPERYVAGIHHASYQHGRANRFTAHAFMARVYFRLGEWDKALQHLNIVIDQNGGMFALNQDPIEAFNRSDASRGNEVIWYALFYDTENTSGPYDATLFTFNDYRATNGGRGEYFRRSSWHTYSMSNSVAMQIGWMDEELNETDAAKFDKRYQQIYYRLEGNRGNIADDPQVYEQQYTNVKEPRIWGDKYFKGPDGQNTNVPVIRLAEMVLTRAIIRFEQGDLQGAADDINSVRSRAWDHNAAGIAYEESEAFVTTETITAEMIHNERIKELAFEGDRLYYLQAMQLPLMPGDRENIPVIPYPHENMYWVIPQIELDFWLN